MVPAAPSPAVRANVRWFEATFDVDGKSVRVQYLSDHVLNNARIADLVARGQEYGRVWIDERAQGTAKGIANAAELIRRAGEPVETHVAARASAADERRFLALRTAEAVRPAAQELVEGLTKTGERVASVFGMRPVPTGQVEREREEMERASIVRGGRSRPGTIIAETAQGETARPVSAIEEVTLPATAPPAETAQPGQKRGQASYITSPYYVMRGPQGVAYEFEIVYDSSRPGVGIPQIRQGYADASFFDRPENRPGIVRYRYRQVGAEEWGAWHAPGYNGREFHKDFVRLTSVPIRYEVRDAEGVVARFNLYIDPEAAQAVYGTTTEQETRRRIMNDLANAADPIKFLRELQEKGLIAGFSTQSERKGEVIWVRGNINNFLAKLERTYGRDASRLSFTQA